MFSYVPISASRDMLYASQICYLTAQCPFGWYTNRSERLVLLGSKQRWRFGVSTIYKWLSFWIQMDLSFNSLIAVFCFPSSVTTLPFAVLNSLSTARGLEMLNLSFLLFRYSYCTLTTGILANQGSEGLRALLKNAYFLTKNNYKIVFNFN